MCIWEKSVLKKKKKINLQCKGPEAQNTLGCLKKDDISVLEEGIRIVRGSAKKANSWPDDRRA